MLRCVPYDTQRVLLQYSNTAAIHLFNPVPRRSAVAEHISLCHKAPERNGWHNSFQRCWSGRRANRAAPYAFRNCAGGVSYPVLAL